MDGAHPRCENVLPCTQFRRVLCVYRTFVQSEWNAHTRRRSDGLALYLCAPRCKRKRVRSCIWNIHICIRIWSRNNPIVAAARCVANVAGATRRAICASRFTAAAPTTQQTSSLTSPSVCVLRYDVVLSVWYVRMRGVILRTRHKHQHD